MNMGFIEWINKANQNVMMYQNVSAKDWVTKPGENIGIFGGKLEQRNSVIEYAISRYLGNIGIIVLHNNEWLERDLNRFQNLYPKLFSSGYHPEVCFINNNNLIYEPFAGMGKNRIAEIIYPELSKESHNYGQQHLYSEVLKKYLDILEYMEQPFSLHNLWKLCNMRLECVEEEILSSFPVEVAKDIYATLIRDNLANQVKADVNAFADRLEGRIWKKNAPQTSVSLVRAVQRNALISIRMTLKNLSVQDYLAAELNYLIEENQKFVLIIDSVDMGESQLKNVILNPAMNFCRILSGSSNLELGDKVTEGDNCMLHKMDKLILFQCVNAVAAKTYSNLMGTYLKKVTAYHKEKNRGAFDFFAGHGKGMNVSEQDYARIKPEELATLGDGAVLIDQQQGIVERGKRFIY